MQSLNQNLFAQVKAAVSMEEGVRFCGLEVPLRGNMRCPFHDDHQPSLTLYPDNYHCWGCGARGDVIDFVARYNQITPLEAARRLAAHAGILVEQPAGRRVLRKKKPPEAAGNRTAFTEGPLTLCCGSWTADDTGVYRDEKQKDGTMRRLTACAHPILPVKRLVNAHSGEEKLQLAFRRDEAWKTITVSCEVCYNQKQVVSLARFGVLVTSENARHLVRYLHDVVSKSQQLLPRVESLSQLGWHGAQFFPCASQYVCDTTQEFEHLYRQFHTAGAQDVWYRMAIGLRTAPGSVPIRVMMAASLSSVLLEPLGALPYIVHLWGPTGTGKTVTLQLVQSIWGNPESGALTRTMNMTANAMARTAAFLHNLPFAADELQQVAGCSSDLSSMVLYLTEGMDKSRARAEGGIERLMTWRNVFLFTGEQPLLNRRAGSGAHNRVLEIEVDQNLYSSGYEVASILREHYGWAGPQFIRYVQTLTPQRLRQRYQMLQQQILDSCDTSEKQAASMAALLLADDLACESIFAGLEPLQVEEVIPYLQRSKEIDAAEQAFAWCCGWIASNPVRFQRDQYGELWGRIADDGSYAMVNKNILANHLERNGYNYTATLRRWDEKGYIERSSQGRYVHSASVYGVKAGYIKVLLQMESCLEYVC